MAKYNVYVLGSVPEIELTFTDLNGITFTPLEARLSIKEPDGSIVTVSGADLTSAASGYLYYLYRPRLVGWHEYEGWGKDGVGREIAQTNGFDVIDRVY